MNRSPVERLEDACAFAQRAMHSARMLSLPDIGFHQVEWPATLFNMAMVGEAAGCVPEEIQSLAPDVPWSKIRGMRNHVLHQSWQIQASTVLETTRRDLPDLITRLRALLRLLELRDLHPRTGSPP